MNYKNKDQILLEQAYDNVSEGIWDRLKGQAAGVAAGLKQGAQNIAAKATTALGGTATPTGKTMGQAYAQSQQKSIFNSFLSKAKSEIKEFETDIQKLGKADLAALKASHPEIQQVIDSYNKLMVYLGAQTNNINKIK